LNNINLIMRSTRSVYLLSVETLLPADMNVFTGFTVTFRMVCYGSEPSRNGLALFGRFSRRICRYF
jgi:hypothetical protein